MNRTAHIEWRADRSGVAHAHLQGRGRTICERYVVALALCWPIRLYCGTCHEALEPAEQPPLVETLPPALAAALGAYERGAASPTLLSRALGISYVAAIGRLVRLRELGLLEGVTGDV